MKPLVQHESIDDARLVERCLTGDCHAFAQVVARYQSLICGIAYSACGDFGRSEDLAQDTFIAAWKNLGALDDPGKLKSWLCGIVRNLVNNSIRCAERTPTALADALPPELPGDGANPHEQAVSKEEELLVWRALETMPADYRETMILFYREAQSTRAVAAALDLSEEAVRQRLSRGRIMLNERVAKTVESALFRSLPGKAFVIGVLAAMPALTISAKAASLGASAAKGSAAAKCAATTGLFGAILAPLLSFSGMWIGYRLSLESAQSDLERDYIKGFYKGFIACIVGFAGAYFLLMGCAERLLKTQHLLFIGLVAGLALTYAAAVAILSIWAGKKRRKVLAAMTTAEMTAHTKPLWEYRSEAQFLGMPLIHLRVGDRLAPPVKAWIAMGDCAFGGLFAVGGVAIAPISFGGCAIGIFSSGGMAIGALALGGLSFGGWCFGGLALGWQAFGACALGWDSACGGVAVARDFALGGLAQAAQANNEAASHHLGGCAFFRISRLALPYLAWMNLILIVPMLAWWRTVAPPAKRPGTAALVGFFAAVAIHGSIRSLALA